MLKRNVSLAYALQTTLAAVLPRWIFDANLAEIHAQRVDDPRFATFDLSGVRWLTPDDLSKMQDFDPGAENLAARFEAGARAACLIDQNGIAGWRWFQAGHFDVSEWLRLSLDDRDVWGFSGLVDQGRRGEGIFGRVTGFASVDLQARGFERILAMSFALNHSAVRAKEKTGATLVQRLFWIRILSLTILCVDNKCRFGVWGPRRRLLLSLVD